MKTLYKSSNHNSPLAIVQLGRIELLGSIDSESVRFSVYLHASGKSPLLVDGQLNVVTNTAHISPESEKAINIWSNQQFTVKDVVEAIESR